MSGRADRLDPGRVRWTTAAGVRTRVYEAGEGEPLLLIHGGAFGSLYSLDAWSLNLESLAADFRVAAFDKLGQGHTDAPSRDADYSYEGLEAHAFAVVDALALGPAHVVGHSMGALLAARLALDRPELVRTLVIVDSNTTAPDDPRYPWTRFYTELAKRVPPGPPSRETVRLEPDAQSVSRAHVTDDWVERMLEIAWRPSRLAAEERVRALREAQWLPSVEATRARTLADVDARGVPVPTLVVWGADDPSAPLSLGLALFERLAARSAEVELHVLARAGHYCFREQPESFERALRAFCLGR
jgi:pimeloyl-ACP methyl ester carboxylesterase